MADITELLVRARSGDAAAVGTLMPLVYQRLRELAHRQLSAESGPRTLDTTGLVHELYLNLIQRAEIPGADRALCLCGDRDAPHLNDTFATLH